MENKRKIMKYLYYIEPYILVAEKQERCQGFACYNKIEVGQVYFQVATEFFKDSKPIRQNLCAKCIQKWFKSNIERLQNEILDNRNNLGKMEGLTDKYYSGI